MPIAFLVIGIVFLAAAVRGEQKLLFDTLKSDFTGPNNFLYWGIALFVIGAIGYYKPAKPLSNAFLVLVFLVLFISNRGFFEAFTRQFQETTQATVSNSSSGVIGAAGGLIKTASKVSNKIGSLLKGLGF